MNTFEKPVVEVTPDDPPTTLLIEDLGHEMKYLLSSWESDKSSKDGTKGV